MRLRELNYVAFGPFTDRRLDLSGGQFGLHLIHGPNEAGKSSLLRGLRQMLFGIPHQTGDNFLHGYGDLRLGATLESSEGETFSFLRRKGVKNTLLNPSTGEAIDDAALLPFLAGLTAERFERLFGIDQHTLETGGEALAEGEGELGQSLFVAGSGLSRLRAVQDDLKRRIEKLYKKHGSNPDINAGITEWRACQVRLREAMLPGETWTRLRDELDRATRKKTELDARHAELSARTQRLRRNLDAVPDVATLRHRRGQRDAFADVIVLPEDFPERRRELVSRIGTLTDRLARAISLRDGLRSKRDALPIDTDLLERTAAVEELHRRLGSHQKAERDTLDRKAEHEQHRQQARRILEDLALDIADDEELRLSLADRTRIRELAAEGPRLREAAAAATESQRQALARRDRITSRLEATPEPDPTGELRRCLDRLDHLPALDEQLATVSNKRDELITERDRLLHRLPLVGRDWDTVARLPLPTVETIDRFTVRWREAERAIAESRGDVEEIASDLRDVLREMRAVEKGGELPDPEALPKLRSERETLWKQIRHAWLSDKPPRKSAGAAAGQLDFGSDTEDWDLADEFAERTRSADALADRLRADAERVARREALAERETVLQQRRSEAQTRLETNRKAFEELRTEWGELWTDCGLTPLPPAEMELWRKEYANISEIADSADRLTHESESLTERRATILAEVTAACHETLAEFPENQSVAEIRHFIDREIRDRETTRIERDNLLADRDRIETELAEWQPQVERRCAAVTDWEANWASALEPLRLGGNRRLEPTEAIALLEASQAYFDARREMRGLEERITGMAADRDAFFADVREVLSAVAPDLAEEDPATAVARLNHRLGEAISRQDQHARLTEQIADRDAEVTESEAQLATARHELHALCQEASCDDPDRLPELERASEERRGVIEKISELEERLVRIAGGDDLERFLEEVSESPPEAIERELTQTITAAEELSRERDEAIETVARLRAEMGRLDGAADAAEIASERETLRTELVDQVEEYVRSTLALDLLRRGIERYRQKHRGPIHARAGDLFRRLTLGSFQELRIDYDDQDRELLAGVRAETGAAVGPGGMSEGTRDQLYLALRIASLEEYFSAHEPVPFIVDDILVNFDDDRSVAALEILGELSQTTQVLFLTHHPRLVEIARGTLAEDVLVSHDL